MSYTTEFKDSSIQQILATDKVTIALSDGIAGPGILPVRIMNHHPLPWHIGSMHESMAIVNDANGIFIGEFKCRDNSTAMVMMVDSINALYDSYCSARDG